MPDKAEALGILLVLLPGFASAYVVHMLAVRRKQSDLEKIVEALLFSLLFYLVTLPFFSNTLPIGWRPMDANHPDFYQVTVQWNHLAALAGLALAFGIVYAANINHDWLMSFFRWINVTDRSSRSTIWNDAFQDPDLDGYVQVGLSGDRKVMGWVNDYSDEEGAFELLLGDAAWVERDGHLQQIKGPGILLTNEARIEYVMFLDQDETDESDSQESIS
jgi:hypothetical protein